jgi:ribosomal-protein-alanine N-acetyltransferase
MFEVSQITISQMERKDIAQVLLIEMNSFPSPWNERMFLSEIRDNRLSSFLVAKCNETVVGYGGFWLIFDEAHFVNLAVHPAFRRRGIGKQLLSALLTLAKERGATRATLEVRVSNTAAIKLYEGFGFKTCAIRKKYYKDNNEDALVMWLENL